MPLTEPEAGSDDANSPPFQSSTQLTDGHHTTTPSSFEANREGEGTTNKEDNMATTTQQSQKWSSNSREQWDCKDTNRDREPRTSQQSSHSNSTKWHCK